ncbi:MAG: polysaccharide pyruvyl transferase family protein [bacterium]
MRVLLGGVPFGRNNVGDEAILECVVHIIRELQPDAEISVSTDDGLATALKLGVRTVPLFGFAPPYSRTEMKKELLDHDVFIWAGATGLSDYPEIPVEMMLIAQAAGRKTVVWAVGMNDELNPAMYRMLPGRRRTLLATLRAVTLGSFDAIAWSERHRVVRAKALIAKAMNAAHLVVVRDPESAVQLRACGVTRDIVVGADSALILEPAGLSSIKMDDSCRSAMAGPWPKVGFCISAQRAIRDEVSLVAIFDKLVAERQAYIVFLPMNPLTDSRLMAGLRLRMKQPQRAFLLDGRREPAEVLALASKMDVISSSRLHLLIFASVVHVPFIGISRGSKVDNFLVPFGLHSAGSVDDCDFNALYAETLRLIDSKDSFEERSRAVRIHLMARLAAAKDQLKQILSAESRSGVPSTCDMAHSAASILRETGKNPAKGSL